MWNREKRRKRKFAQNPSTDALDGRRGGKIADLGGGKNVPSGYKRGKGSGYQIRGYMRGGEKNI